MAMTYGEYLHLDQLLNLQEPSEHDEMLFIIVHQAYELWFKLLLHELEHVRTTLSQGDLYGSIATLKRCRTVMKLLVEQVDVVETLTPMSFTTFRTRLQTASGFQSVQFRELEFLLGYKRPEMLRLHHHPDDLQRLQRRLSEPSLGDALLGFLRCQGEAVPQLPPGQSNTAHPTVEEILYRLHRTRPDLVILFELLTDFDEGFQEWRYRHIKLVERTIGARPGTGGSHGVEFLKQSLFNPVFPDLWNVRNRL
ncbi:MAG: tryptophan 2,3-dioxygenase family protein [Gemmataceae bacterium]